MTASECCVEERGGKTLGPLLQAATRLCRELADGRVSESGDCGAGLRGWFNRVVRGDLSAELAWHRRELASEFPRPFALLRFARFLGRCGFADLATVPWSTLARQCPDDSTPALALANLFLARARRTDRSTAERLRDFDRFFRYASRAAALLSDSHAVRGWMRTAGAELTLLKGQYELN